VTTPASLRGHAAIVTGAGRNIGRAIVLALAARGCDVVVNTAHRRADAEAVAVDARKHGVRAVVAVGDVGRRDDVNAIVGAAGEIGTVDIVVNNAAIRPRAPFLEMTDAEWQRVIDVDLSAAFYMARAFAPAMVARGWGRIVNITGMNAMQGTHDGRAHVAAAKHGLWGLTKALARELGPKGVTVNPISPGPILGEQQAHAAYISSQLGKIPLGRLGTPDDIARLTAFLASDDGGFVSGQMIGVNGAAAT